MLWKCNTPAKQNMQEKYSLDDYGYFNNFVTTL